MTNPRETNTTTHFMRELRALLLIRDVVAVANAAARRKTVVWSVGCSTGDEPYGLAMLCRATSHELDILATDINPDALERAQRGRYHERNLRHVDSGTRARWFTREGDYYNIATELREQVRFRKHDITREAAPRHDVDVALCRNVMVYFNAEQIQRAVATICAALRPGGLLILGASEWLRSDLRLRGQMRLVPIEKSNVIVYQRVDGAPPVAAAPPATRPTPPPPAAQPATRPSDIVDELRAQGDTKLDLGQPVEAAVCYAKALALAPLLADLHLRIALCYLHTHEPKLAYDSLRRALFLTPQLWEAWLLLADLAHEPAQARRYLHQARDLLEASKSLDSSTSTRVFPGDPTAVLAAVRHRLRVLD